MEPTPLTEKTFSRSLLDVLIRAGLIVVLVLFCFEIFSPFRDLMLWALILAITLYPLQKKLRGAMGNKDGRIATLIVLLAILILVFPIYVLGTSIAESVEHAINIVKGDTFHIPPPDPSIEQWPLVGKSLSAIWTMAATDLPSLIGKYIPQIRDISLGLLSKLAGVGMGFLIFLFSRSIAGSCMAHGEGGAKSAVRITSRISGPLKGPKIASLCTSTIRAVAMGVVGIAFIQMLLVGLGFVLKGVPGAGLLAMAVLLLGIMQLPVTLVTLPVIAFVLATEGASTATIVFSIYVFVAGLVDNVLKPMLLGRGVDVPMPVVLIGALGGMVTSGIIGLFIGPVVLAVGYQLFWQWVEDKPQEEGTL